MVYDNVCNGSFYLVHTWWLPLRRCTVPENLYARACNFVQNGLATLSIFVLQLWVILFYNKQFSVHIKLIQNHYKVSYLKVLNVNSKFFRVADSVIVGINLLNAFKS